MRLQLLLVKQRPACSLCRFVSVGSSERSVSMEARTQQLVAGICGGDRAALGGSPPQQTQRVSRVTCRVSHLTVVS